MTQTDLTGAKALWATLSAHGITTILIPDSSIFSLLPDILPMIMPASVEVTKGSDLEAQRAGKNSAMVRQGAVIGKSEKMCATGKIHFPLSSCFEH